MKNNHVFSPIGVSSFTAVAQDEEYAFNVCAEVPTCMKKHNTLQFSKRFFSIKTSLATYVEVCAPETTQITLSFTHRYLEKIRKEFM